MNLISLVLTWVWSHMPQISATATVIVLLLRAIPSDRWLQLEQDWPRLANLARILRAIFPDVVKAAKAIYSVWTGRPWPVNGSPPKPPPSLLVVMIALCACVSAPGVMACSATPKQVVHVSIVTAGTLTAQLISLNNEVYERTVREQNPTDIEPLETEYMRRAHALAAITAALYAAASINDMVGVSAEQRQTAARQALMALEDGIDIITDGTLLPEVQLTPAQRSTITSVIRLLSAIIQTTPHTTTAMDAAHE